MGDRSGLFDERICLTGTNTEQSGYALTRKILSERNRPDALITGNDNMAVGAYRAIHEMGLRIPEDVSQLTAAYTPDYGVILFATVLATLPTLAIFFFLQRQFVQGLLGAVK